MDDSSVQTKRMLTAFLVSAVVLVVYMKWFAPPPPKAKPASGPTTQSEPESRPLAESAPTGGVGATTTMPPVPLATYRLKNASLDCTFTNAGAALSEANLLKYAARPKKKGETSVEPLNFIRSYPGMPTALALTDFEEKRFGHGLETRTWKSSGPAADGRSIAFVFEGSDEGAPFRLTKTYTLQGDSERLTVDLVFESLAAGNRAHSKYFLLNTSGTVAGSEYVPPSATVHTIAGTNDPEKDGELRLETQVATKVLGADGKQIVVATPKGTRFLCDIGNFFGAYLRPEKPEAMLGYHLVAFDKFKDVDRDVPVSVLSKLYFRLETGEQKSASLRFDYYLGPKSAAVIEAVFDEPTVRDDYIAVAKEDLNPTGIGCFIYSLPGFSWVVNLIAKVVLFGITFFGGLVGNYGVAIMIVTFCVRLFMFPINRKSQVTLQRHAEKMGKLKPKLDALKEKYKDNQQRYAQEQMRLFKEEKVSLMPLGGCLPIVFQLPIFFGLFAAIRASFDLRHAAFIWCSDLSRPDGFITWSPIHVPCLCGPAITIDGLHILPFLMMVSQFIDLKTMPQSADPQMKQQQKMMQFMPFVFGLMLYGNAAGLSLYYLTSSLMSIVERRIVKRWFPSPVVPTTSAPPAGTVIDVKKK